MHGIFNEDRALAAWNLVASRIDLLDTGEVLDFLPYSAELQDCLRLGASYDGVAFSKARGPIWVEIKCPAYGERSQIWKQAKEGKLTSPIYWQMAHQFLVLNSPLAIGFLFVYIDEGHYETLAIDEDFFGNDLNKLESEWINYMSGDKQAGDMIGIREFNNIESKLDEVRRQRLKLEAEEADLREKALKIAQEQWPPDLHLVTKYYGERFTIRKRVDDSWVFARARKAR